MNKKKYLLAFLLASAVGVVGCTDKPKASQAHDMNKPQPALKTTVPVEPLKGCKDLRARGGAC